MSALRREPITAFRFLVILADSGSAVATALNMAAQAGGEVLFDAGFSRCSGLSMEQEPFAYEEGGVLDYTHKLPGQVNHGNITLHWGMGFNDSLWEWCVHSARSLAYGRPWVRKDGAILALPYGEGGVGPADAVEGQVWYFRRGMPVRWSGPEFDAGESAVAIESLEIAHEGLERWWPSNLGAITEALGGGG